MRYRSLLAAGAAVIFAVPALAAASPDDHGTLWILTDLSYELPSSSSTSVELGLGLYGLGGGFNLYTNNAHVGLMVSARLGWLGVGYAANAELNWVGRFSKSVSWRLGAGIEYLSVNLGAINIPIYGNNEQVNLEGHGFIPVVDASIGFRF